MAVAGIVILLLFFLALLVAVLLGTPEQQAIVTNCINQILGTISIGG